jgi:hypothetical protein
MMTISHWGLFCWPAGVSRAAIDWALDHRGEPWFKAGPSEFGFHL